MSPLKVIIAGGRDFDDYDLLCSCVDQILHGQKEVEFISGCARGADTLGEKYARSKCATLKKFHADWNKHGKAAGPIRNSAMAQYAAPDGMLIAFHDGVSRGTADMINKARWEGLIIHIMPYNPWKKETIQ